MSEMSENPKILESLQSVRSVQSDAPILPESVRAEPSGTITTTPERISMVFPKEDVDSYVDPDETKTKRRRGYAFTDHGCPNKCKVEYDEGTMEYLIFAEETCPKSGKLHWQGYVYFRNGRTLSAVIKSYKGVHFEPARASPYDNMRYCKKTRPKDKTPNPPEKIFEFGTTPQGQGTRTDIQELHDMCKREEPLLEIAEKLPSLIVHATNGVRTLMSIYSKPRDFKTDVYIYFGPPGAGKTRAALDNFGGPSIVYFKPKSKWWDGYMGQPTVVIDDYDPYSLNQEITFNSYLTLTDRYPHQVEIKGSYVNFKPKNIVFTSNYHPSLWFQGISNREAFFRRVTDIQEFMLPDTKDPLSNEGRTSEQDARVRMFLSQAVAPDQ